MICHIYVDVSLLGRLADVSPLNLSLIVSSNCPLSGLMQCLNWWCRYELTSRHTRPPPSGDDYDSPIERSLDVDLLLAWLTPRHGHIDILSMIATMIKCHCRCHWIALVDGSATGWHQDTCHCRLLSSPQIVQCWYAKHLGAKCPVGAVTVSSRKNCIQRHSRQCYFTCGLSIPFTAVYLAGNVFWNGTSWSLHDYLTNKSVHLIGWIK